MASLHEKPDKAFVTSIALSYQPTVFSAILFAGEFDKGLSDARKNGFDAVEIGMRDPAQIDEKVLRDKLEKYSLKLSAIATGQSYLHDQLSLFSENTEVVEKAKKRLKAFVGIASEFGAFVIIGGIRGKLSGEEEKRKNQWDNGIAAIKECADFARKVSVTLLLEPINRYETNIINTAEEGLNVIKIVDAPNLKLLLDTFHMNIEERDIHATLESYKEHIGYVHFADSNRHAPGQGHINFSAIVETLKKINYSGYISVEILPLPDDEKALSLSSDHLHSILCL